MKWMRFTHLSSGNSVIVHILSVFLLSVESIKLILHVVSFFQKNCTTPVGEI